MHFVFVPSFLAQTSNTWNFPLKKNFFFLYLAALGLMEKQCKKAKWLAGEALQKTAKRREVKSKGEMETYIHLKSEIQRNNRER